MERPSHIAFHPSHMSRRLPLFALAAFLQVGAVSLIMTGLGHFRPIVEGTLHLAPDFKQPTIDTMPPPDPVVPKNIPVVAPPIVDTFTTDRGPGSITVTSKEPDRTVVPPQPPAPPDRAAVGITATHTTPPYPAIAIRQGVQGQVVLKLTVLETGRVGRADIVTSSGSEALDQAA